MIEPTLDSLVAKLCARQRMLSAVRWTAVGLLTGAIAALALTAVFALRPHETLSAAAFWSLAAIPASGLHGFIFGWLRRIDVLSLLRAADRAANSDDRLASAWQLADHHRAARVKLVKNDALLRAGNVSIASALPFRVPKAVAWLPLIALAIGAVLWWGQRTQVTAADDGQPRLSAEQWSRVRADFENDWQRDRKPNDAHRKQLEKELRKLGESLTPTQEKRTALRELAELRSKFESRRNRLKSRDIHLRQSAAAALKSSEMLKKLAELLKKGEYKKAAQELKSKSELLRLMKLRPNAEELESIAKDFERLAKELELHKELNQACRNCAQSAQSLNQKDLAKSLQDLAERLMKESDDLNQNDNLSDACETLNRLERELADMKPCPVCKGKNSSQCSHCSGASNGGKHPGGQGSQFVRRNGNGNRQGRGKKGGLKAGKGSAKEWFGGKLGANGESRLLTQTNDRENNGRFEKAGKTVSAKEEAASALAWKEKFLKNVRKAEADLELERVPHAYRDYLRRYFKAIQPKDDDSPAKQP